MTKFAECIVWFQNIEHTLSICISAFANMEEEFGRIVISQMSFNARVSTLAALATHRSPQSELHEDVVELFKRVRWAEQERNRLVHSMWDLNEEIPGTLKRQKASNKKNRHRINEENYFPEDFDALEKLFEGINTDLIFLLSKHFPEMSKKLHY